MIHDDITKLTASQQSVLRSYLSLPDVLSTLVSLNWDARRELEELIALALQDTNLSVKLGAIKALRQIIDNLLNHSREQQHKPILSIPVKSHTIVKQMLPSITGITTQITDFERNTNAGKTRHSKPQPTAPRTSPTGPNPPQSNPPRPSTTSPPADQPTPNQPPTDPPPTDQPPTDQSSRVAGGVILNRPPEDPNNFSGIGPGYPDGE